MQCYICQKDMGDDFQVDTRDLKPRPCTECEEVIAENLEDISPDHVYSHLDDERPGFGESPVPAFLRIEEDG